MFLLVSRDWQRRTCDCGVMRLKGSHFVRLASSHLFLANHQYFLSERKVMRKREKRTERRRGLGNLPNLEIHVGAHGMMFSVNRQIFGDEKFGVCGVDGRAQRWRWWIRIK